MMRVATRTSVLGVTPLWRHGPLRPCLKRQCHRKHACRASSSPAAAALEGTKVSPPSLLGLQQVPEAVASSTSAWTFLSTAGRALVKATALVGLAVVLVLQGASSAEAARSGGRIGGGAFRGGGGGGFGSRSSSRSSSSSAFGSHSRGGGGGGSFLGGSFAGSSFAAPHSSSSFSRPSVSVGFMPVSVSPLGYGYGYGGAFGSTLFTVMIMAVLFMAVASAYSSSSASGGSDTLDAVPTTIAKVQVGCLGMARELKADLDNLAQRADTSTSRGLHLVLQETVLALLRNPSYCAFGASSSACISDPEVAEQRFNAVAMEERSKFAQETLTNVGGITRRSTLKTGPGDEDGVNELTVVTLLVAAESRLVLPKVSNLDDLRQVLSLLGGLAAHQVVGVELLWTPQAEGDFFTRDELISDYPNLVPL